VIAMAITFVAGLLLLGTTAFAADPVGNNGTVKIDDRPFDNAPDNEPHDGCVFQVDFYGFDKGDIAEVTFTAYPPTSDVSGPGEIIKQDSNIDVGEDAAGGGTDLDASETYSLDFSDTTIEPSEQQGFHVKLTVTVTSPNSVTPVYNKHKVFWVQPCEEEVSSSSSTSSTTTTTLPGGGRKGEESSSTTSSTVIVAAPPGRGALPFTGSNSLPLTIAGLALLLLGGASLVASRRRQRHQSDS
jgi:LPXTG-motif cell wall-anchored protein